MLASKAGLIHREMSNENKRLNNGLFSGFFLDSDYALNWMEVLELAGAEVSEEAWAAFVQSYNEQVVDINRPASVGEKVPGLVRKDGMKPRRRADSGARWTERLEVEERTVCHCPSRQRYKR